MVVEDVDVHLAAGTKWFFNHALPRHSSGRGYVRVFSTPFLWTEESEGLQVVNAEGLVSNVDLQRPWTISRAQWNFLRYKAGQVEEGISSGQTLVDRLYLQSEKQKALEADGYRCLTWRMLHSLQAVFGATRLQGATMVTAAPFFDVAGRGGIPFWGQTAGPEVVLWDTLDANEQQDWKQMRAKHDDYIIVRRKPGMQEECVGKCSERPPGRCVLTLCEEGQKNGAQAKRRGSSAPTGRGHRAKGWWSRGDIQATLNEYDLECWVHERKTAESIGKDRIRKLPARGASWECTLAKDECRIRLDDRESQYWLGTEPGQLGLLGFMGRLRLQMGQGRQEGWGLAFACSNYRTQSNNGEG